jgi:hypothetical protein
MGTKPATTSAGAAEKQITFAPHGHILTNIGVWSPDSRWIVYDTRSDPTGSVFDGSRIEKVNIETSEVKLLYESRHGAHCGVVTYSPVGNKVVFIHGPENPTPDWQYGPPHRQGVLVDESWPGPALNLDARDLTPPFTRGALRGGSHVHVFSGDGLWVSFTYNDHLLAQFERASYENDIDQRNVGVSVPLGAVRVTRGHPRNQDSAYFSVLVTRTMAAPRPGSDEIQRADSDAWVGVDGYLKPNGARQRRAIAFQGEVLTQRGGTILEAFIVDIPDDVTIPGDGPLEGTSKRRPLPPQGTEQRRLTFTADRPHPGLQGPRHWLRSSPDGSRVAFLMRDDAGVVQMWTVSPNGGDPVQLTRNAWDVASAFSWSPDGRTIAYAMDNSIFLTDVLTGRSTRLTQRSDDALAPRPEACVFSPDGKKIAYVRRVPSTVSMHNQIFVHFLE